MKKAERLRRMAELFGRDHVVPFEVVRDTGSKEVEDVFSKMYKRYVRGGMFSTMGIRTDTVGGNTQGLKLPFCFPADYAHTVGLFHRTTLEWARKRNTELEFIVACGISGEETRHNVVALRADLRGDYLLEWDDGGQAQRAMESARGDELHRGFCSPDSNVVLWCGGAERAKRPRAYRNVGWDALHPVAWANDLDEVTYSVTDRGIFVW